jgi:uncharacterized lipoprotein
VTSRVAVCIRGLIAAALAGVLLAACSVGPDAAHQYDVLASAYNDQIAAVSARLTEDATSAQLAAAAAQELVALRAFDDGLRRLTVPVTAQADLRLLQRVDAEFDVQLAGLAANGDRSSLSGLASLGNQATEAANQLRADLNLSAVPGVPAGAGAASS